MWDEIAKHLGGRTGHFELESRHHAELWLDLELLFRRPDAIRPLSAALADRLAPHGVDAVCGPLVEGAFVALQVADELGVDFSYAERHLDAGRTGLFPVTYRIPGALRAALAGRRVAVVNDVVNAGSAVRATLGDLQACGARPVAIASLLVLGSAAGAIAEEADVPVETLASRPNRTWLPDACPLCAAGVPLVPHPGS